MPSIAGITLYKHSFFSRIRKHVSKSYSTLWTKELIMSYLCLLAECELPADVVDGHGLRGRHQDGAVQTNALERKTKF